ncbi:MAG: PHP domain-containing protein [Actinobacteria bacterium]|nr:PHP domain-containing protein [Actinomycetota bacterium]MCL5887591.1 PHP domain-containing protein [Actinomycetota bacterium]
MFDFHVHSNQSDGHLTPRQLVEKADHEGLLALSLTDHDSIGGIEAAAQTADELDLIFVPGVEFSAILAETELHILTYFIDHTDPILIEQLDFLRHARVCRARRTVDLFRKFGVPLDFDEVVHESGDGVIGRVHLAKALVSSNVATDVSDAFSRFLGQGRPFYLPKESADPIALLSMVSRIGGCAVLAHPGINGVDRFLPILVEAGLAGIEVYHPLHTPEQVEHYRFLAAKFDLIITGGSDFHGIDSLASRFGVSEIPVSDVARFLAASDDPSLLDRLTAMIE